MDNEVQTERVQENNSVQGHLLFFIILYVCFHEFIFIITSIVVVWIVANEIQAELCNLWNNNKAVTTANYMKTTS